jgi:hypothetical protein
MLIPAGSQIKGKEYSGTPQKGSIFLPDRFPLFPASNVFRSTFDGGGHGFCCQGKHNQARDDGGERIVCRWIRKRADLVVCPFLSAKVCGNL